MSATHAMLPGRSGLSICQELRQLGSGASILMLTARRQTKDKVIGLRIGADDYLTKPFKMIELLARIDALLRRTQLRRATSFEHYQFGGLQIDVRATQVTLRGRNIPMSATEFRLLRYLAEHRGATLSREELLREVWNYHPILLRARSTSIWLGSDRRLRQIRRILK
jgi:two-component system alkaline phosphatase synthesis response regulator PhoP